MKNKYLLIIFLLIIFCSCSKNRNDKIKSSGIVDGDIISLKTQVAGKITKWYAIESKKVEKGDTLAQIDNNKVLNNLDELLLKEKEILLTEQRLNKKVKLIQANINYLSKQVKRFNRLNKKSAVSGDNLENMELKLLEAETTLFDVKNQLKAIEVQKAQIENKKEYINLLLEDYVMQAPVSGIILETFVSENEVIFPGSVIADVLDLSSLYVEVFLEEEEIGSLKLNQQVDILIDGLKNKKLTGAISYFGRKAEFSPKYIISEKERKGLLYQVKIKIAKSDAEMFKVGMPVTVIF